MIVPNRPGMVGAAVLVRPQDRELFRTGTLEEKVAAIRRRAPVLADVAPLPKNAHLYPLSRAHAASYRAAGSGPARRRGARHASDGRAGHDDGDRGRGRAGRARGAAPGAGRWRRIARRRARGVRAGAPAAERRAAAMVPRDGPVLRLPGARRGPLPPGRVPVLRVRAGPLDPAARVEAHGHAPGPGGAAGAAPPGARREPLADLGAPGPRLDPRLGAGRRRAARLLRLVAGDRGAAIRSRRPCCWRSSCGACSSTGRT